MDDPKSQPLLILIKVKATALNQADLLQKRGLYPPPTGASDILGLGASGTIEKIAQNVKGRKIGDRICALLTGGGYAESRQRQSSWHEKQEPISSLQWDREKNIDSLDMDGRMNLIGTMGRAKVPDDNLLKIIYQMRLGVFAPRFYRAPLDKFPLKICGIRRRL
ncbi:hypothetical protein D5F11_021995 [Siminovitchia terrae]|uniref:Alcohol dehydrogenase-like N-terminal domain-containing protein n=1 Tax=Siminovitchia terrae TaxID=1914933 RepID=A0A429X2R0_SIMTE|nr:hypothetical protein D5F11_021995 [Siminovitchia terrae]